MLSDSEKHDIIGNEFAGCKILSKLGSGGMGSVYKARHIGLDKLVCIKILSPQLAQNKRNVDFFIREARSIAKLDHPNIVQVYHVGKEKGIYFLMMSYVDGKSLDEVIKSSGPLKFKKATR
ncbi:MAG TPA: protein kinase, partial [Elusimicrobiales bacterium]|nr:protein kinase [Elusimicrobiales bacterium]